MTCKTTHHMCECMRDRLDKTERALEVARETLEMHRFEPDCEGALKQIDRILKGDKTGERKA